MIDPHNEAQVRAGALQHAMQTATPGESHEAIVARAFAYAEFVLQPVRIAQASAQIGEPKTPAIN